MTVLFLLLSVLLHVSFVRGVCPDAWIQYQGSCYHLFQDSVVWAQAMVLCQSHKAHLVSIDSLDENRFLENLVKTTQVQVNFVWIGANDLVSEGEWRWSGTDEKVTFNDWSPGEPDNWHGIQDCAVISPRYGYKWDDGSCNLLCHYICEISLNDNIIG